MVKFSKPSTDKSKDSVMQGTDSEASVVSDQDSENDSGSGEDSESEEEDVTAIFKGLNVPEEQDSDESSEHESGGEEDEARKVVATHETTKGTDRCTFDLRNILAVNSHQIAFSSLYKNEKTSTLGDEIAIPLNDFHGFQVDEEFLLSEASRGCTQLVRALWQLPTERSDAGPLVQLPGYDEMKIPRALPPPPPKEETKWEKFAKAKGIPLNKEKRSRKVWDEAAGAWLYRHGYEKANKKDKEWPIMEVGGNDDPFEDPWEKLREAKRARTEKNIESRMKNQERAGVLAKGTTNRAMKSREKTRTAGKVGGSMDRYNSLPTGVPVDLQGSNGDAQKRGKTSTMAALQTVQRSTASLGKFDKMREGEPERKKYLAKIKKRRYESATDKKVLSTESEKSIKILNSVMNGGGVAKEKAIRKGKLAKGETAFDFEYDDGLGASSFRKKKGRAGAGKMKKMTKKRVK